MTPRLKHVLLKCCSSIAATRAVIHRLLYFVTKTKWACRSETAWLPRRKRLAPCSMGLYAGLVHLVVQVRLLPSDEQSVLLRATLERCNEACSWISSQAVDSGTFRQFALHRLVYTKIRAHFGLGAQMAVRCIAKVADSHKAGKKDKVRRFRRHAAQPYDARLVRWGEDYVSLWTLEGRIKVPFRCRTTTGDAADARRRGRPRPHQDRQVAARRSLQGRRAHHGRAGRLPRCGPGYRQPRRRQ